MGFLDFGKKKKKLDLKLDVPPIPPPGLEQKEFPEIPPSHEEFPPLDDIPKDDFDMPAEPTLHTPNTSEELPLPPPPMVEDDNMPSFVPPKDDLSTAPELPEEDLMTSEPNPPKVEKRVVQQDIAETRFITMDKFKNIIGDIDNMKYGLKKFESELPIFSKEEKGETTLYVKLKNMLNGINKNLKSVDRILFEG